MCTYEKSLFSTNEGSPLEECGISTITTNLKEVGVDLCRLCSALSLWIYDVKLTKQKKIGISGNEGDTYDGALKQVTSRDIQ